MSTNQKASRGTDSRNRLFNKSLLAMCVMAAASPSFAQQKTTGADIEEVVITGLRASLQ